MKCYICGRSKKDFTEFLSIDPLQRSLAVENIRDQVLKKETSYEISRKKYIDQKASVENLKPEIASLKISTVKNDVEPFKMMEPSIELILEYYDQFEPIDATTVGAIAALILREPMHSSLSEIVALVDLSEKISTYKVDPDSIHFYERKITKTVISSTHAAMEQSIEHIARLHTGTDKLGSGQGDGLEIALCPVCNSLLADASRAAHQTIEAQNDYGDDEDYI